MLKQSLKLFKMLNADVDPSQIAAGFVLGMVLGFTPLWSLHNILVLLCVCVLRINISAVLLSFALFSGFAYLLDPAFIQVGEKILTDPSLASLWTSLYQQDIWRLAHFNHTLTMGSLAVSLALLLPLFFFCKILIIKYREKVLAWIMKSQFVQGLKATKWFQRFQRLSEMTEVDL